MLLRKTLASFLFLALASSAFGSVAYVQSNGAANTATSGTVPFSSNVANGDLVAVYYLCFGVSSATTPTDTLGTSFHTSFPTGSFQANTWSYAYFGFAPSGGADTVSYSGISANQCAVIVAEYSGVVGIVYAGASNIPSGTTFTTSNGYAPLTSQAGLVVSLAAQSNGCGKTATWSSPSGGSVRQQIGFNTCGDGEGYLGDAPFSAQTSYNATNTGITLASGASGYAVAILLLPSGGGGGSSAANSGYAN